MIYVGKAKNLRNRLSNYFQPLRQLHPRTQTMVLTARSLEWTVVGTELEALTLEYTWIKEFDPRSTCSSGTTRPTHIWRCR